MEILKRKELIGEIIDHDFRNNVKLLTGVRCVGKTTLIKSIMEELRQRDVAEENILYVSFDSPEFYRAERYCDVEASISEKLKGIEGKIYLFLDHVEEFGQWQSLANHYRKKSNFEVIAAVNYSKFYNPAYKNVLGGRSFDFEVYPFSFKEFVEFKRGISEEEKSAEELFCEYVRYGGMPEVVRAKTDEKLSILGEIYNLVKWQDMIRDNDLEHYLVDDFLRYMVMTFTEKFSKSNMEKSLYEFDCETLFKSQCNLKNSGFMSASNMIFSDSRWKFAEKYYLIDHGFFRHVNRCYSYVDDLLRNIVYVELLRRGYRVFFSQTREKYIDFICQGNGREIFIQFDFMFASDNVIRKEIDFLNYYAQGHDKYIITAGDYDFSQYGIMHLNIIDFLMGDEI
jgi:hypothetical protein